MTDERCLSDPYFWEMMPWNDALIVEFSEVSGIPVARIRRARAEYLRSMPHRHVGTPTIH